MCTQQCGNTENRWFLVLQDALLPSQMPLSRLLGLQRRVQFRATHMWGSAVGPFIVEALLATFPGGCCSVTSWSLSLCFQKAVSASFTKACYFDWTGYESSPLWGLTFNGVFEGEFSLRRGIYPCRISHSFGMVIFFAWIDKIPTIKSCSVCMSHIPINPYSTVIGRKKNPRLY